MSKIVATVIRRNAVQQAFASMKNSAVALVDFMYGTPERSRLTVWFAIGLAALGVIISDTAQAMAVCPIS